MTDTSCFCGTFFQEKKKAVILVSEASGKRRNKKCCNITQEFCPLCRAHTGCIFHTFLKYLWGKCLIHMAALTHRVDKVHVCAPLTNLSCLTYIFPAHSPTILALFLTARPDPFGLLISSFWAQHQVFLLSFVLFFFCKIRSFQCLPWLRMSRIALTASAHSTRGTVVNNAAAKANKVSRIT